MLSALEVATHAEPATSPLAARALRAATAAGPRLVVWAAQAATLPAVVLRRARPRDVEAIHALLERYAAQGLLLPRTREQVRALVPWLVVAWDGQEIVGCGALRRYATGSAEIGALAVAAHWHGQGVGRVIVDALLEEAQRAGVRRVFALTLQDTFFHRLGFRTVRVDEFPEKVAADCATCARRTKCIEIAVVREVAANGGDVVA
jgi:amino-acid N-acetyltransferase